MDIKTSKKGAAIAGGVAALVAVGMTLSGGHAADESESVADKFTALAKLAAQCPKGAAVATPKGLVKNGANLGAGMTGLVVTQRAQGVQTAAVLKDAMEGGLSEPERLRMERAGMVARQFAPLADDAMSKVVQPFGDCSSGMRGSRPRS